MTIPDLSTAEAGSDELSARIMCALAVPEGCYVEQSRLNGAWCIYEKADRSGRQRLWERRDWYRVGGWPVSTSIDAAVALVERVLPGARWELSTMCYRDGTYEGNAGCRLWKAVSSGPVSGSAIAPTPPLAILRALQAAVEGK